MENDRLNAKSIIVQFSKQLNDDIRNIPDQVEFTEEATDRDKFDAYLQEIRERSLEASKELAQLGGVFQQNSNILALLASLLDLENDGTSSEVGDSTSDS